MQGGVIMMAGPAKISFRRFSIPWQAKAEQLRTAALKLKPVHKKQANANQTKQMQTHAEKQMWPMW